MKKLTQKQLIRLVSQVTEQNIKIRSRSRDKVTARSIYFKICRDIYKMNISLIANSLNMHHASVLYNLNNFKYWARQNKEITLLYDEILGIITTGISVSGTKKELKNSLRKSETEIIKLKTEISQIKTKYWKDVEEESDRAVQQSFQKLSTNVLEMIIKEKASCKINKGICKEILSKRFA